MGNPVIGFDFNRSMVKMLQCKKPAST